MLDPVYVEAVRSAVNLIAVAILVIAGMIVLEM